MDVFYLAMASIIGAFIGAGIMYKRYHRRVLQADQIALYSLERMAEVCVFDYDCSQ